MTLQLTSQQQQAIDSQHGEPLILVDPRTNASYYLVSSTDYESIQELLEEDRAQKAIRAVGLQNAGRRLENWTIETTPVAKNNIRESR
ncbi:MAG: hypothetical protein WD851_05180 [Pirellulales bacterium]